jgi:hypothetical protein
MGVLTNESLVGGMVAAGPGWWTMCFRNWDRKWDRRWDRNGIADGIPFAFASAIASKFAFSICHNQFYEAFSKAFAIEFTFQNLKSPKRSCEPARPRNLNRICDRNCNREIGKKNY